MMMTKLEQRQAQALAAFINTLRPDWDATGVYAALGKARDLADAPSLAIAAIRAAATPTNRTPAVIAMQGDHWTTTTVTSTPTTGGAKQAKCDVYGHEGYPAVNCPGCRADALVNGNREPAPEPYGRELAADPDREDA